MRGKNPVSPRVRMQLAIDAYWQEYFQSPTIREAAVLAGMKSTSMASLYIKALVSDGTLVYPPPHQPRAIIPVWVRDAIKSAIQKEK